MGLSKNTLLGSAYIASGTFIYATYEALGKLSGLKLSQILIFTWSFALLFNFIYWKLKRPSHVNNWYGDKPYIKLIWLRGIIGGSLSICIWYAIIKLPLGDASCFFFQTPLIVTILSKIFLNDKLLKLTPIIMIFAIIGILFISH